MNPSIILFCFASGLPLVERADMSSSKNSIHLGGAPLWVPKGTHWFKNREEYMRHDGTNGLHYDMYDYITIGENHNLVAYGVIYY